MSIRDFFYRKRTGYKTEKKKKEEPLFEDFYEYCPNCEANLTLQKGYNNAYAYWKCRGCGKMLINPDLTGGSPIVWICDKCGAILSLQAGFSEALGEWECRECGFKDKLSKNEIYISEEEYQADLQNPYKGMPEEALMDIMEYEEIENIGGRPDIILVENRESGKKYVKKIRKTYEMSVYDFLKKHPVDHMPRLYGVYEGANYLVVIEEYIAGKTLSERMEEGRIEQAEAVGLLKFLCVILKELHSFDPPIIHRDIKPSNILITGNNEVFLLDVNVAKWYNPTKKEDTRLLGTMCYAAPEQLGYGFAASSVKTDIYAVGVLLNVMLTGKFPKEEKASGSIWKVIERCISYEPEQRFTDQELIEALNKFSEEENR